MPRKTGPSERLSGCGLQEVRASGLVCRCLCRPPDREILPCRSIFFQIFKELYRASAARSVMHQGSARVAGATCSIHPALFLDDDGHLCHRFKILTQAHHPWRDPLGRADVHQ